MGRSALTTGGTTEGATVTVGTDDGDIVVDASMHTLTVESPRYGLIHLGASRAGFGAAVALILEGAGLAYDTLGVGGALAAALRLAATRSEYGCPVDRFPDRGARWSPLAWSARFLASPYLVNDVERFFPCRVALAHVEDEQGECTVDAAAACVEALERPYGENSTWRSLFSPSGDVGRPLNATLAEYGENASAFALWGLRRVPLTRKAASAGHLEVLGALGRHPRAAELTGHMHLVELAAASEIEAGAAAVPRRALGLPGSVSDEQALAEMLAVVDEVPAGERRLSRLAARARRRLEETCDELRRTARPPVPLPRAPGVRFLATVGDIAAEGRAMRHCVATRAFDAVSGRAFLFHVDVGDEGATVQVDGAGRVVEARGPANASTGAAVEAGALLEEWGWAFPGSPRPTTWTGRRRAPLPTVAVDAWRQRKSVLAALEDAAGRIELDPTPLVDAARDKARLMADGVRWLVEERRRRDER